MIIQALNHAIQLMSEKALFLPDWKALIIGDLHFGKANHFRRSGLPVPFGVNKKNVETLVDLINKTKPDRVIFLGDLFHSHYNDEWEVVGQVVKHFSACKFQLVMGNHDIMSRRQYDRHTIEVCNHLEVGPFFLTHEPLPESEIPKEFVNVAGHIHPGAHFIGKGRQALTFPCFWFSEKQWILPAFGSFTGLAVVRPAEGDRVFVIIEDKIMEVGTVKENMKGHKS
jgi:uncharacterized protein